MGREGGLGDVGPLINVAEWAWAISTLRKTLDVLLCEPGIVDVSDVVLSTWRIVTKARVAPMLGKGKEGLPSQQNMA